MHYISDNNGFENFYLLAKGVRKLACIDRQDLSNPLNRMFLAGRLNGCFQLSYTPFKSDKRNNMVVLFQVGYEKEAEELVKVWDKEELTIQDHRHIGLALGYDPELVEEFCVSKIKLPQK